MLAVATLAAVNMTVFKSELAKVSPREIIFYENFVGAVFLGPLLLFQSSTISADGFIFGAAYGTIIGFVAYLFSYFALSRLNAAVVAIISYFELVVAVLIAVLYYSEPVSRLSALGGFLIVASALGVRLAPAADAKD